MKLEPKILAMISYHHNIISYHHHKGCQTLFEESSPALNNCYQTTPALHSHCYLMEPLITKPCLWWKLNPPKKQTARKHQLRRSVIMILILSHKQHWVRWATLHLTLTTQLLFWKLLETERGKVVKEMIFSFWRFAKGCPWSLDTILMHCTPLSDTSPAEPQHIAQKGRMS